MLQRKLKSLERSQESSHLPAEEAPSTSQVPQTQEAAIAPQSVSLQFNFTLYSVH